MNVSHPDGKNANGVYVLVEIMMTNARLRVFNYGTPSEREEMRTLRLAHLIRERPPGPDSNPAPFLREATCKQRRSMSLSKRHTSRALDEAIIRSQPPVSGLSCSLSQAEEKLYCSTLGGLGGTGSLV